VFALIFEFTAAHPEHAAEPHRAISTFWRWVKLRAARDRDIALTVANFLAAARNLYSVCIVNGDRESVRIEWRTRGDGDDEDCILRN
jgi:hypothetical protein